MFQHSLPVKCHIMISFYVISYIQSNKEFEFESCEGVIAAQFSWHLWNINVIKKRTAYWYIFSKSFYCATIKLGSQAYQQFFHVCVNYGPCSPYFGAFFLSQIGPKCQKSTFNLFCKGFPLDSHETYLLSSLELFLEVCRIWSPKSHILGSFFTLNRNKVGQRSVFHLFCKRFSLDSHKTCFKAHLNNF